MTFKIHKIHYLIFFLVIATFILMLISANLNFGDDQKIILGVTFSKKQCDILGLNWKLVFWKVVNEMPFQVIRVPVYWDEVEKSPGQYNFEDYDWLIKMAQEKNIEVVPVFGRRVPRWPECHAPKFYAPLPEKTVQTKILDLLKAEVTYFKKYDNIKKWQIDNEPFLAVFGNCPPPDKDFIQQEINLVKSLDNRPVIVTESGELSSWLRGSKSGDILGISMYRQTWNKRWGYFFYPLPPAYYYFKAGLIKILTGVKQVINTELQTEPWVVDNDFEKMPLTKQFYSMDLNQVKTNVNFAKKSGIQETYLWGVEWWWWLGEKHGQWDFWEYGKTLNNAKK